MAAVARATERALVIGAGPAGSSAAIALAQAGGRGLIVERTRLTGDALCGGFMSWATLASLRALGVDATTLGGHPVSRVRVIAGNRSAEVALPATGMGLSRHRLDTVLLARAEALGAAIERGVTVRGVANGAATLGDGATLSAVDIFVATGKHGLRDLPRVASARVTADPVLGLRRRLPGSVALDRLVGDAVELILFDRGYAGLVQQEDGSINLCLAVHKSRLSAAGGDPAGLIAQLAAENPALAARLDAAGVDDHPTIDAIAAVPYGWRTATTVPGIWRLGDQAGVIPSLAGEGMGIAIASARSAVAAFGQGVSAPAWQARFARQLARPLGVAGLLWRAGENPSINRAAVAALARVPQLLPFFARATRIRGDG